MTTDGTLDPATPVDPAAAARASNPLTPEATAADFQESPELKIGRLERALADQRKFSRRMGRQLHARLRGELRDAERRARTAERDLQAAVRRAEAAEAELAAVRGSATWRAGNAVLAVPRRLRSLRS